MARILVVETDEKGIEEIKKAILMLNPDHKIASFDSLANMRGEVSKLDEKELAEFFTFDLMILDYLAAKPAEWEAKLADLRTKNKNDATVCFTAYDNVHLTGKQIENLKVFNILYKPYDQLILKESINIALSPHKNVKPAEMRPQSFKAEIAILKEIDLMSISELGFVTLNDKAIPPGGVSKYFSGIFSRGKKRSVWAQCLMSIPLPQQPGTFISKFQYVGLEPEGLMAVRKFIQQNKKNQVAGTTWSLAAQPAPPIVSIALIDTNEEKAQAWQTEIESHFENVKVDFLRIDPSKKTETTDDKFDLVINLSSELKHDDFKNRFKKDIKNFLLLEKPLSEDATLALAGTYRDIFVSPDKPYLFRKLKVHHKALSMKEAADVTSVSTKEKVKAATIVKITEICELYVNVIYSRELAYGTMRDFVFTNDDENQLVELPAFCNFAEKVKRPGEKTESFFHQFVFFGMTDHYLKQIRIWLLESFVKQKGQN